MSWQRRAPLVAARLVRATGRNIASADSTERLRTTYQCWLRPADHRDTAAQPSPPPPPPPPPPAPLVDEDRAYPISFEPELVPPLSLMHTEGITVLEEWYRWAEEWSMLLRVYGGVQRDSALLEIGCGLGRIAFPLRYVLSGDGTYDGFEICREKVDFLRRTFSPAHPNFRFEWADVHNTFYNPDGRSAPDEYRFPYPDDAFDIVFAASVFTHLLPRFAAHYFAETARVLKPGGTAVFSFFLLDNYESGRDRPLNFSDPLFDVDHAVEGAGPGFAVSRPDNPEEITAFSVGRIESMADHAGLRLVQPPLPGLWSGSTPTWVGMQDVVLLERAQPG